MMISVKPMSDKKKIKLRDKPALPELKLPKHLVDQFRNLQFMVSNAPMKSPVTLKAERKSQLDQANDALRQKLTNSIKNTYLSTQQRFNTGKRTRSQPRMKEYLTSKQVSPVSSTGSLRRFSI